MKFVVPPLGGQPLPHKGGITNTTQGVSMRSHLLPLLCALLLIPHAAAQQPTEFKGHGDKVHGLAFNSDGKLLATAGFDNNVKIWDFATGKEQFNLTGHTGPVYCVAFSPDAKLLASG